MVKMVIQTKTRSFEIPKLKNFEKLWNPFEFSRICGPSKSQAQRNHSFKLGSKSKYLNSDQLLLPERSELGYSKSAPTNVE